MLRHLQLYRLIEHEIRARLRVSDTAYQQCCVVSAMTAIKLYLIIMNLSFTGLYFKCSSRSDVGARLSMTVLCSFGDPRYIVSIRVENRVTGEVCVATCVALSRDFKAIDIAERRQSIYDRAPGNRTNFNTPDRRSSNIFVTK